MNGSKSKMLLFSFETRGRLSFFFPLRIERERERERG
jgi:hypothetical protein